MKQSKLNPYWSLQKGDSLKGKKIIKIDFYEDKYSGDHLKIFHLEDGSEYFLDNSGLRKVEQSK